MSSEEPAVHERRPIRWIYPIVGGIIAEGLTIAFTALVLALSGYGGPGAAGEPIDPAARRIGAVLGAAVGSSLCFILGWWAARLADGRFQTHGLLTGASSAFLSGFAAASGGPGPSVEHVVALLVRLFAGWAGGRMAERMAAQARGREP